MSKDELLEGVGERASVAFQPRCDTHVPCIVVTGRSLLILFSSEKGGLADNVDTFTFISAFPRYFFKCSKQGKSALLMHSQLIELLNVSVGTTQLLGCVK